jgi:hypothetical protein
VFAAAIAFGLMPGDPPAGRELALSLNRQGRVLVWYKPCVGTNGVSEIRLTAWKDNRGDSPVLWQVQSSGIVDISVFEIGVLPSDFETVQPLERDLPDDRLAIGLERRKYFSPVQAFNLAELKEDRWLRLGKYFTEEQFAEADTCSW